MKSDKVIYFLFIFFGFLTPRDALAHGEQALSFFGTLGVSFALFVPILNFEIEGKYKALLVLVYFLVILVFILMIIGTQLSMIVLSFPKMSGFLINVIALGNCYSLYTLIKRHRRKVNKTS